jgi:hypothetical protein
MAVLRRELGEDMDIELVEAETIPSSPSGKFAYVLNTTGSRPADRASESD